jgi:hypothetical protein
MATHVRDIPARFNSGDMCRIDTGLGSHRKACRARDGKACWPWNMVILLIWYMTWAYRNETWCQSLSCRDGRATFMGVLTYGKGLSDPTTSNTRGSEAYLPLFSAQMLSVPKVFRLRIACRLCLSLAGSPWTYFFASCLKLEVWISRIYAHENHA